MRLVRFGPYPIPQAQQVVNVPAERVSVLVGVAGRDGAIDALAGRRPSKGPILLDVSALIVADRMESLDVERDAVLRLAYGERLPLVQRLRDGSERWTPAQLTRVQIDQAVEHVQHLPIDLSFALPDPSWYAMATTSAYLADGLVVADGSHLAGADTPVTIAIATAATVWNGGQSLFATGVRGQTTILHAGNRATRRVLLLQRGPATNLRIRNAANRAAIEWVGTLGATDRLEIDAERARVRVYRSATPAWSDAYDMFTWDAELVGANIFPLEPGPNPITVSSASGSAGNLEVRYATAWEA